jgi:hypothetical protein
LGVAGVFAFLLTAHILSMFIGFGPIFAFPFIGILAEREPMYGNVLIRLNHMIGKGLAIPMGLVGGVFGVLLWFNLGLDLTKNVWLGVAILLYVLAVLGAIFHQTPTASKMIKLTAPDNITPEGIAEAQRLAKRLKLVGTVMTLMLVAVIVLMAWKPGLTV